VQRRNFRIRRPAISKGDIDDENVRNHVRKFVVVGFEVRHGNAVDVPNVFLFVAGDGDRFHERESEEACSEEQAFFYRFTKFGTLARSFSSDSALVTVTPGTQPLEIASIIPL